MQARRLHHNTGIDQFIMGRVVRGKSVPLEGQGTPSYGKHWGPLPRPNDAAITGTLGLSATLYTFNEKHYRVVPGLVTARPYTR